MAFWQCYKMLSIYAVKLKINKNIHKRILETLFKAL